MLTALPTASIIRAALWGFGQLFPFSEFFDNPGQSLIQSAKYLLSWFRIGRYQCPPRKEPQDTRFATPPTRHRIAGCERSVRAVRFPETQVSIVSIALRDQLIHNILVWRAVQRESLTRQGSKAGKIRVRTGRESDRLRWEPKRRDIDDILIYSPTIEEHRRHVIQRLRQHHLYLKTEKCEFHKSTIHFLGYIVTPAGVQMDQRKVEAVKNWPQPTTIKEMQRFLGFANFYRRFIAHYSQLAAPLTSLLRQKAKSLTWTAEAHRAFTQLKSAFCTAPALSHPDPNIRFLVEVDAATLGVGAVLSQWKGEPPRTPSMCILLKETVPGGAELRRG